ncbi:MAG TPA: DUF952 domain-containing protein [Acidimicrobiales bacterium]
MSARLYHLATRAEWDAAAGTYAPGSFAREGFVHCSYAHQVAATAARYYAGRDDLVLLEIDPARLDAPVIEEPSPVTGERFPHVYGVIPCRAVVSSVAYQADPTGVFPPPPRAL